MVEASFFSEILGLTDPAFCELVAQQATLVEFAKGDMLIRAGQPLDKICFCAGGIFRAFELSEGGAEVTSCLMHKPGCPLLSSTNLTMPSTQNIEALTSDCRAIVLDMPWVLSLIDKNFEVARLCNRLLQDAWNMHFELESAIRSMSSKERYLWFLDAYPGVIDRIPHRYVASLLGMTPVTLSRVRTQAR